MPFCRKYARGLRFLELTFIDLVLSNTHLSDGSGFRLLMTLAGLPVTAFLCLPVENSCCWRPAIDAGQGCLGSPALRPREFASALQEMVRCLPAGSSVSFPVPEVEVAYVTFAEGDPSNAETRIYSN